MSRLGTRLAIASALLTSAAPACLDFGQLSGSTNGELEAGADASESSSDSAAPSDGAAKDSATTTDGGADACVMFDGVCGGSEAIQVAVSTESACALLKAGVVYCWGANQFGEVGQAPDAVMHTPTQIPGLDHVTQIGAGYFGMCALRADTATAARDVYCWGNNQVGQLGHNPSTDANCGASLPCSATPTLVAGLGYVKSLAVGGVVCATTTSGSVLCWGPDYTGELGRTIDGGYTYVPGTPSNLSLTTISGIAIGYDFACATSTFNDGCWGANALGQLGHTPGTDGDQSTLYGIGNFTPPNFGGGVPTGLTVIGSGDNAETACGATSSTVSCWGQLVGLPDAGIQTFSAASTVQFAIGNSHACLRASNGDVSCWGNGAVVGVPDAGAPTVAPPGSVVFDAIDISAGNSVTLAVAPDGSVWGWGANATILGTTSRVPSRIAGLP